jgi:hypothetical protein
MSEQESWDGWAIVEMMGHKRAAGRIRETTLAGAQMLRLDVPGEGDAFEPPQLIAPAALYRVTMCTEAEARKEATWMRPRSFAALPVSGSLEEALELEEQEGDGEEDIPFDQQAPARCDCPPPSAADDDI